MNDIINTFPIIQFANIEFAYRNSNRHVLKNINYNFYSHNFYVLTGESGAGKTTFLKLIYRKLLPSKGDISVLGYDTKKLSNRTLPEFRQNIGLITSECDLFDHLSVIENVLLPIKLSKYVTNDVREHAIELLVWLKIGDYINHLPTEISTSQKLAVMVARSAIQRPKIILVDDVINSADYEKTSKIFSLFYNLTKKGTTVIVGTNNKNLASTKGINEIRIRNGNLIAQSTSSPKALHQFPPNAIMTAKHA